MFQPLCPLRCLYCACSPVPHIVHKLLPKQRDIDKILEVIQRKVLKGTHLPEEVKEIQVGYLYSPYFKDLYLYLSQNKLPSSKSAIRKLETLSEKYVFLDSLLFRISPEKGTVVQAIPGETTKFLKVKKPIHVLQLPTACSATSPNFHLPPGYKTTSLEVNISLDMANIHKINISSLDFHIWQHLEKHWNESQLQHLASIPSVPLGQLNSHLAKGIQHITPFSPEESTGDTIWTLFVHTGVYVTAIGSLIPAGLGIFCCYFFWCWPARLAHQPLQPGTMQYTIVDDDVEAAPIYRCDGKASQPARPCRNYGLHIEHIHTQTESM